MIRNIIRIRRLFLSGQDLQFNGAGESVYMIQWRKSEMVIVTADQHTLERITYNNMKAIVVGTNGNRSLKVVKSEDHWLHRWIWRVTVVNLLDRCPIFEELALLVKDKKFSVTPNPVPIKHIIYNIDAGIHKKQPRTSDMKQLWYSGEQKINTCYLSGDKIRTLKYWGVHHTHNIKADDIIFVSKRTIIRRCCSCWFLRSTEWFKHIRRHLFGERPTSELSSATETLRLAENSQADVPLHNIISIKGLTQNEIVCLWLEMLHREDTKDNTRHHD